MNKNDNSDKTKKQIKQIEREAARARLKKEGQELKESLKNGMNADNLKGLLSLTLIILIFFAYKQCTAPKLDSSTFKVLKTSDFYDEHRQVDYANIYFGVDQNGKWCELSLAKQGVNQEMHIDLTNAVREGALNNIAFSINCTWYGKFYETGDDPFSALKVDVLKLDKVAKQLQIGIKTNLSHGYKDNRSMLDFEYVTFDIQHAYFDNLKLDDIKQ